VTRQTPIQYISSCKTRVNVGSSIFFAAAIIRVCRSARSSFDISLLEHSFRYKNGRNQVEENLLAVPCSRAAYVFRLKYSFPKSTKIRVTEVISEVLWKKSLDSFK
jgi:hypothetical protein